MDEHVERRPGPLASAEHLVFLLICACTPIFPRSLVSAGRLLPVSGLLPTQLKVHPAVGAGAGARGIGGDAPLPSSLRERVGERVHRSMQQKLKIS